MRRFIRHQRRILRKSIPIAIIYITALLYFIYNIYLFVVDKSAAVKFAKEEIIILISGVIIGTIVHVIVKRSPSTGSSMKLAR
jgi:hypothetical protein